MCPTGIVLTDSPYDSATDTLAEKRVQKYGKKVKTVFHRNKKIPQPKLSPELRINFLLYWNRNQCSTTIRWFVTEPSVAVTFRR